MPRFLSSFNRVSCLVLLYGVFCPAAAFGFQRHWSTKVIACSQVPLGETAQYKTPVVSGGKYRIRVYASIQQSRDAKDAEGESCKADFTLFISREHGSFKAVKQYSEVNSYFVGAEIIGFSPNGTKVGADFFWEEGDVHGPRPVIYDIVSGNVRFGSVGTEIIDQLPSCDYFEQFVGITDAGEAIIHIPKSVYVDEGCPDQGDWLFNLVTGKAIRRRK